MAIDQVNYQAQNNLTHKPVQVQCGQINLHHASVSTTELNCRNYDVELVLEPHIFRERVVGLGRRGKTVHSFPKSPRALVRVNNDLNAWPVHEFTDRDVATVGLWLGTRIHYLAAVYMDIEESVEVETLVRLIERCETSAIPLIIGCDANSHNTLWGCPDNNRRGNQLEDFISANSLIVKNRGDTPTFVTDRAQSIIDLTLTNRHLDLEVAGWMVDRTPSFSDHRYILFRVETYVAEAEMFRNLKRCDWDLFKSSLLVSDLPKVEGSRESIDECANAFNDLIQGAIEGACPKKRAIGVRPVAWWTPELAAARSKTRRLHACSTRPRSSYDTVLRYREAARVYKVLVRNAKRSSWRDMVTSTTATSNVASLLKALQGKPSSNIGYLCKPDGDFTQSPTETVDLLMSTHFPGCMEGSHDLSEPEAPDTCEEYFTPDKVREAIQTFGPNKAAGPDGLKPCILQALTEDAVGYLTDIFTKSLAAGYVPAAWREMKVVFIPKPGKATYDTAKAFRPITLSNFVLKTMERVLQWKLTELIGPMVAQHAYTKGRSTESALTEVVDQIESAVHRGKYALCVSLDCTGAFDYVRFSSAKRALLRAGAPEAISNWYDYLLRNRHVTTTQKGVTKLVTPTRGSPQGGVLSPLVWNVIIDEILREITGGAVGITGYADDLFLLIIGIDPMSMVDLMQRALDQVLDWGDRNGLSFNPTKTVCMVFTLKTTEVTWKPLMVQGQELAYSQELTYLGLTFDSKLTWSRHVEKKTAKCRNLLSYARQLVGMKWGLTPGRIAWVYAAIVRPTLMYGALVWRPNLTKSCLNSIKRVQRLAMLNMAPTLRSTPTTGMEATLGLLPLDLFLEAEATMARLRTRATCNLTWDGLGQIKRRPHRRYYDEVLSGIEATGLPQDQPLKERVWDLRTDPIAAGMCIYTDGSREENRTGAGFCITRGDKVIAEECIYIGAEATVFQAEVVAINLSMRYILAHGEELETESFTLHSDSQAALGAIKSRWITSSLVKETVELIVQVQKDYTVSLNWIKGHADHTGNEHADYLAKLGNNLGNLGPLPHLPLSRTYVKGEVRRWHVKQWQARWEATAPPHSKLMLERVEIRKDLTGKLARSELAKLVQYTTGHCLFNRHLSHWRGMSGICRLCSKGLESPHHLLVECKELRHEQDHFVGQVRNTCKVYELHLLAFFTHPRVTDLLNDADEDLGGAA